MKKGVVMTLAAAGVLVVGGVALFLYLSKPVEALDYTDGIDGDAEVRNVLIMTILAVGGLDDAFVDASGATVYIGYDVPATSDGNETAEDWQFFAIGAAAEGAPESQSIVVKQFVGETVAMSWTVQTAKVLAYQRDEISDAEFEAAITKA